MGSGEFVERVLTEAEARVQRQQAARRQSGRVEQVVAEACKKKQRIADGTQKREPTWEAAHDKSGIGVQAGGRFWRRNRRGCAPTGNIDFWGFEDID